MVVSSELANLLSLVSYRADVNHVEGLEPFRGLLEQDVGGEVLRILTRELDNLQGRVRAGVAYVIAEHYRKTGNLVALQRLFATDHADVKEWILNALRGEPPASAPGMGPGIVALALESARHPDPGVRAEACSVIQNQCAWGVDVSAAREPLLSLLRDANERVRIQAACAVGNLAKRKYAVADALPDLRLNLRHVDYSVRSYSAWALWELSRARHDIGAAVVDLVNALAKEREDYDDVRKHAAGALLHHARKSPEKARQVKRVTNQAKFDGSRRRVRRFQEELENIE
jgi:hypothetical protein